MQTAPAASAPQLATYRPAAMKSRVESEDPAD
jgi:hypothetical protein